MIKPNINKIKNLQRNLILIISGCELCRSKLTWISRTRRTNHNCLCMPGQRPSMPSETISRSPNKWLFSMSSTTNKRYRGLSELLFVSHHHLFHFLHFTFIHYILMSIFFHEYSWVWMGAYSIIFNFRINIQELLLWYNLMN